MPVYTIKFLDRDLNVEALVEIECTDDATVIAEAHRADILPTNSGFEIREGERLVHKHRR
jgi:hypothetical protein